MKLFVLLTTVIFLSFTSCKTKKIQEDKYSTSNDPSYSEQQNNIVLLLEKNKLVKAQRAISKCFKSDTTSISYLILKGRLERKKGNNAIAENYFKLCIQIDSLLPDAYAGLGIIYYLNGNSEKGLKYINKAINIDSNNMDFYNDRSAIYYDLNKYEEAYEDIKRAYLKHPSDQYLIHNMGTALNSLNRFTEAIEYFNIINKLDPKEPRNYFDRGIAYYYIGEPKKAIEDLKKALTYNHRTIKSERIELYKIYHHLSLAYIEIEDFVKSEEYKIKAINSGQPINTK